METNLVVYYNGYSVPLGDIIDVIFLLFTVSLSFALSQGAYSGYRHNQVDPNPLLGAAACRKRSKLATGLEEEEEADDPVKRRRKAADEAFGINPLPVLEKFSIQVCSGLSPPFCPSYIHTHTYTHSLYLFLSLSRLLLLLLKQDNIPTLTFPSFKPHSSDQYLFRTPLRLSPVRLNSLVPTS